MKYLIITTALSVVFLTSPASVLPKVSKQTVSGQTKARRKTKVDVRYNKKADLSTARLEDIVLFKNPVIFEGMRMLVTFDYPKRTIVTPKSVSLVFFSATKGRRAFRNEDFAAVVDGVGVDLGPLERRGNGNLFSVPGETYFDARRASVPFEKFTLLAQAKKLTLSVGGNSFDLEADQMQMLADFLQLMQEEGQEFK